MGTSSSLRALAARQSKDRLVVVEGSRVKGELFFFFPHYFIFGCTGSLLL